MSLTLDRIIRYSKNNVPIILKDLGGRPDSNSSAGAADTGQIWTPNNGSTWGRNGGKIYKAGNGSPSVFKDGLITDVKRKDYTASVNILLGNSCQAGFYTRWTDINNNIQVNIVTTSSTKVDIYIVSAKTGVFTQIGFFSQFDWNINTIKNLRVIQYLNTVSVYIDGKFIATGSTTDNTSSTLFGLYCAELTSRFSSVAVQP